MKKLLLSIILIISLSLQAQDKDYITSLNSLNKVEALNIATQFTSVGGTKWEFMFEKENKKSYSVFFVKSNLSQERKELLKSEKRVCETGECCSVIFRKKKDNTYKFDYVLLEYKELFPIWKKYFSKDADPDILPNDYLMQEYKDGYTIYKFKPEQLPYWSIDKF